MAPPAEAVADQGDTASTTDPPEAVPAAEPESAAEPDLREMVGGLAGVRRWFDRVPGHLRPGERACCAATAFLKGQTGVVLATTERLMFVRGDETPFNAEYPAIHDFHARMGLVVCDLQVEDESGPFVFKQIHPKSRLRELAALLGDPPTPEPRPAPARTEARSIRVLPTPPPAEAATTEDSPVTAPPGQVTDAPVPAVMEPAPAWLRAGERVIGEYGAVELLPTAPGQDAEPRPGTVSVTNLRVVFAAGADIREWPFELLDPASEPGAGIRTALTPDSSVIFDNAADARAFEATLRSAAGLADS